MKNIIFITLLLVLASGCTSTGTLQGVSHGQTVQIDYEQAIFENDGKLRITMPDDEHYIGKFVQSSTSGYGTEFVLGESHDDDSLILKDSSRVSSQARALLLGNRSNTMECRFQLSSPEAGIEGGGIGNCETSHGQKIAVTF